MQVQQHSDQTKSLQVVYPLDDYFAKSGPIQQHLQTAVQKIREAFKHQLKKIIQKLDIKLILTKAYFSKHGKGNFKQKSGILFQIQTPMKSLPKMFFAIQKLFNQRSITFFSLDTIVNNSNYQQARLKMQQENMDLILLNSSTVGVINYSSHKNNITYLKSILTTTKHLISIEQFDIPQIKIIIKDSNEIRLQLKKKNVCYIFEKIDEESFGIVCDQQNYYDFLYYAKKYLEENKKQQTLVQQFQTQFQIFIFKTYYAEEIKNQFPTLVFYEKQKKLYRRNKIVQSDQIYECMKMKRKQMYKKIIKIPSIYKIQGKKVQMIKNSVFCKQYLIRTKKYKFMGKIDLFIKSLHSLRSLQQNVVFVINNKDGCRSFQKLLQQNEYKASNYLNQQNQKKYKGIHQFHLQKSRFFSSILMCSIQKSNRNCIDQSKLSRNITDIIQKFANQKQINIVFPSDSNGQLVATYMKIFKELIKNQRWDRLKKITMLLQDQDQIQYKKAFRMISTLLQTSEMKQQLKIVSQSRFYLSKSQLQKIFFLEFYQVKYTDMNETMPSTFSLSNINSFLINLAINSNKGSQTNIPVSLVQKGDYQYEYVVNIQSEAYHKLDKYCNIAEGYLHQNKQLQTIIRTIRKYFLNITYFVIYQGKDGKLILDSFYFHACSQNQEKKLKKMILSEDFKKITIRKKEIIFKVLPKSHLSTYEIHVYKQFQSEAKKLITNFQK